MKIVSQAVIVKIVSLVVTMGIVIAVVTAKFVNQAVIAKIVSQAVIDMVKFMIVASLRFSVAFLQCHLQVAKAIFHCHRKD